MFEGGESMTATEMARLSDWMKSKGMTSEDFDECLHYIANECPVRKSGQKNQAPGDTDMNPKA